MSKYYLPFEKEYEKLYKKIKKEKENNEWFSFHSSFEDQGKQGSVGLLTVFDKKKVVFKSSQYYNHLVRHEFEIMKSLRSIRRCCPHFCLGYKILTHSADFDFRKKENPFEVERKRYMKNEVVLMQWIKDSIDFTDFITQTTQENVIYSTVKQVLCALTIAQHSHHFCHYDLHSSNVLMSPCDPNLSLVYVLDKDNIVCVPTDGYIPKIIDYGFSYTKDLENKTFYGTLAHTDVGFMSCTNDFISDLKLFLVTVSYDVHHHHNSDTAKRFRNIVKNIFSALNIDWESGWDHYTRRGAADQICEKIKHLYTGSTLFKEYDFHCIDLFQTLIKLPLQNHSTKNLELSFDTFIQEFKKIEAQIQNPIVNMYLLRKCIDLARIIKKEYMNNKEETVKFFRTEFLKIVDHTASFCNIKGLNYEKLLCSMYVFSECCEGLLFNSVREKIKEGEENYSKLDLTTPEQMYACLEINLPHKTQYTRKSSFLILDTIHNDRVEIKDLPDFVLLLLNRTHPIHHGKIIFDYITQKLNQHIETYEELQQIVEEEEDVIEIKQEEDVIEIKQEEEDVIEIKEEEEDVIEIKEEEDEDVIEIKQEEEEDVIEIKQEEEVIIEEPKPKKRGRPKKSESDSIQPKKRGRPPKKVEEEPKKRGRPKKSDSETIQPKKRGRPKKKVEE